MSLETTYIEQRQDDRLGTTSPSGKAFSPALQPKRLLQRHQEAVVSSMPQRPRPPSIQLKGFVFEGTQSLLCHLYHAQGEALHGKCHATLQAILHSAKVILMARTNSLHDALALLLGATICKCHAAQLGSQVHLLHNPFW